MMKKALGLLALAAGSLSFNNASANSYWLDQYSNQGQHFSGYEYTPSTINNWQIHQTDHYLVGDFVNYSNGDMVLAIKPGNRYVFMHHLNNPNKWWELMSGGHNLGGFWPTSTSDKYVTGDFDGDGREEILAANPNGHYRTLRIAGGSANYSWQSLQFATNGDIDAGDRLIAGDFDGDNIDETMLIKANGSHYTMKFNTQTSNWDIISNGTSGSIYWWIIAPTDRYVVADFNNDGKDDLLAVNPNGWHHVMKFENNFWQYMSGNGSGYMGYWRISGHDQYIAGDFDKDGSQELLAINPNNGWSHTIDYHSNAWSWYQGNGGSGHIANWSPTPNSKYTVRRTWGTRDWLLAFDPNGWWKFMSICKYC